MPLSDTSPAAETELVRRWREMSSTDKAALIAGLSESVNQLAMAGIQQRYPGASPRECFLRLAALRLGEPLALAAYPEIANLPERP